MIKLKKKQHTETVVSLVVWIWSPLESWSIIWSIDSSTIFDANDEEIVTLFIVSSLWYNLNDADDVDIIQNEFCTKKIWNLEIFQN